MTNYRDYHQPNTTRGYDYEAPRGGVGVVIALAVIVLFIAGIVMFGASTSGVDGQSTISANPPAATGDQAPAAQPAPAE